MFAQRKARISLSVCLSALVLAVLTIAYSSRVLTRRIPKQQVIISEVCVNGLLYDWVELQNLSDEPVSLNRWYLSDRVRELDKYPLPADAVIEPQERLVIACTDDIPLSLHAGETIYLSSDAFDYGSPVTLSSLTTPATLTNGTWGIDPSGKEGLLYPTPGEANKALLDAPAFSAQSGIYPEAFSMTIQADDNVDIWYTTDCTNPLTSSTREKYTGEITIRDRNGEANVLSAVPYAEIGTNSPNAATPTDSEVDKAFVLRAAVCNETGCSETTTAVYYVGDTFKDYENIPLASLVLEPDDLIDPEHGIYVKGIGGDDQPNYKISGKISERTAFFSLLTNQDIAIEQTIGTRISGNVSRSSSKKSFRLTARKTYGAASMDAVLLPDMSDTTGKTVDQYRSIILRSGGNSARTTVFDSSYYCELSRNLNFISTTSQPVLCFLNGEFWGCYELQSDVDAYMLASIYNADISQITVYKGGVLKNGTEEDKATFEKQRAWVITHDMRDENNYATAASWFDISQLVDYYAAELYLFNRDWPSTNFAFYRIAPNPDVAIADGRWRPIMYDMDQGAGFTLEEGYAVDNYTTAYENTRMTTQMLRSLLENDTFRTAFIQRTNEMIAKDFSVETSITLLEQFRTRYEPLLALGRKRMKHGVGTQNMMESRYQHMVEFAQLRAPYALEYMHQMLANFE